MTAQEAHAILKKINYKKWCQFSNSRVDMKLGIQHCASEHLSSASRNLSFDVGKLVDANDHESLTPRDHLSANPNGRAAKRGALKHLRHLMKQETTKS